MTSTPPPADQGPTTGVLLSELALGSCGRVVEILGNGEYRQRLLELGLTPGVEVRAVRSAPLGDPIEIELRGAGFSIRRAEAACVRVEVIAQVASSTEVGAEHDPRQRSYRVALVGNPNVGKTSLFNALTGHSGQVGNYPGITVDRLVGKLELEQGLGVELIDVPGTYTLNARSRDEQVAIAELLGQAGAAQPDAVIVVLRYATLQRGLYFLMQVQELGLPVVAVVNMMDEARAKGYHVDLQSLSEHFDIPFVGTVAQTGEGHGKLRQALSTLLERGDTSHHSWHWTPSAHLAQHLDEIGEEIGDALPPAAHTEDGDSALWRRRAFALWCLMSLGEQTDDEPLVTIPGQLRRRTLNVREAMIEEGHDLDLEVTQARYQHIDVDVDQYGWKEDGPYQRDVTQRIDSVLTHPLWGMLVFLAAMGLIFAALFDWSTPAIDGIEWLFNRAAAGVRATLPPGLLAELLAGGIITGVGSVLAFLPQILLLFFFIALLESTGYMSRVAFMTDRLMQKLGLHGRAFVPLLSGFACAVPAVMAARTIERRRDRLLTIMALPLVSCSARLPVYTLIISALFPATRRVLGPLSLGMLMMLAIYVLSTLLTLTAVGVLGRTVLKGRPAPLLLELPPYRLPMLRGVFLVLWHRCKVFVKTAGTVILAATIVLWALLTFPRHPDTPKLQQQIAAAQARKDTAGATRLAHELRAKQLAHSLGGRLGRGIEPVIAPLGFDWKIGVGLIGAFAAREVFVSTMGLIYGVGAVDEKSSTLRATLRAQRHPDGRVVYTPLTGLALLVFFMIAMQCVSTLAVVRLETGSWRWPLFQLAYLSVLAYLSALAVYQIGRALGFA